MIETDLTQFGEDGFDPDASDDVQQTEDKERASESSGDGKQQTEKDSEQTFEEAKKAILDVDGAKEVGVVYARVSSPGQVEGESLDAQIDELDSIADERDIELPTNPIQDKGKTGTDFNRGGIQKVLRLANQTPLDYVFVDTIDRLGRAAAQTHYFIHVLQVDCDVSIFTSSGEMNVQMIEDVMQVSLSTLMAELATKNQGRGALRSRVRNFIENRKWGSWYPTTPLGYTKSEDSLWIEKHAPTIAAAEKMFEYFVDNKSYSETARLINKRYLDSSKHVSRIQIKSYLQNPVYLGRPTIPVDNIHNYNEDDLPKDPELKLVDEESFERVQEIVEKISEKYSSNEDVTEADDIIDEFGLFPVAESSPMVKLVCSACGGDVVRDGTRPLDKGNKMRLEYKCSNKNCGQRSPWPKEVEYTMWKTLSEEKYSDLLCGEIGDRRTPLEPY